MDNHKHKTSLLFKAFAKTFKVELKAVFFSSIRKSKDNYSKELHTISKEMFKDCYNNYYEDNKVFICDPPSEVHVTVASSLLAGYKLVLAATKDETFAFTFCRDAFIKVFKGPAGSIMHALLHLSKDPFAALNKNHFYIELSKKMYGETFEFESTSTDDTVDLYVNKCLFIEMFKRAGNPALTQILCHWDSAWVNAINDCGKPYTSEYKSRMSDGDTRCHYCFHKEIN